MELKIYDDYEQESETVPSNLSRNEDNVTQTESSYPPVIQVTDKWF